MNTEHEEKWVTPGFQEISSCMECTAYAETLLQAQRSQGGS